MPWKTPISWIRNLYPPTAFDVCARKTSHESHLEGVEDPHTHPEPPTDKILSDFFCPNKLECH